MRPSRDLAANIDLTPFRIPVADGDLDQTIGYIKVRDLLGHRPDDPDFNIRDFIKARFTCQGIWLRSKPWTPSRIAAFTWR